MKSFRSNPDFQEKVVKSVKTEIIKRQPTILSTIPSPVHTNLLDSQSTTSKGPLSYCFDIPQNSLILSTTPYEYMTSNVSFSGHEIEFKIIDLIFYS
ncbi:unnamed protein product [Rotaria sordida]|uniref:Uncharacterized protein n=1 Tax=Rotaria sordida TaxID=392033 RepID=A0A814RJW6_9BILA|nr:unnamed protein product [Rotaria sordida]CAF1358665.1 unnamed protein product [Rotaria sordida]CAF3676467.1 unnamed protein product [Rotaria sordida]CAF4124012.1 unnamed protein product [Rotaria sordida]